MPEKILLVGMMGSGKTTVGRQLAEALGWPYIDSDAQVEAATGRTVREIWESDGEGAFRTEESRALRSALTTAGPAVVAVAGGAVLDPGNRELIAASGAVVWLRADVRLLAERVSGGAHRPLLAEDPEGTIRRLDDARAPIYAELADIVLDVDALTPVQVVSRILEAL